MWPFLPWLATLIVLDCMLPSPPERKRRGRQGRRR
jgi:hypothetical protein